MNAAQERREVRYRGRVQGVGFRYTTMHIARQFNVTGYVKNLADGSVELVAEGPPDQLDAFLEAVAEGMRDYIRDVQQTTLAASGEFSDFGVRY